MKMRLLFIATAIVEFTVGFALILSPSFTSGLLLDLEQSSVAGTIVSRIAGAALIAISIACFATRDDKRSVAARGLLMGLFAYNMVASATLLYAGFSLQFSFILLSAIITHVVLLIWCGMVLLQFKKNNSL